MVVINDQERKRRPRRDALANRARILDYAEQALAVEGADLSMHRIAEALGLGIGTLYRHFPTYDDLLLGVYERFWQRIDDYGDDYLRIEDPLERVIAFIDLTVRFSAGFPAARGIGVRVRRVFPDRVEHENRWTPGVVTAVIEAQQAGTIRPDVQPTDIAVLAGMLADLVAVGEPQASFLVPRMRALALDALRPVGEERPPLPAEPISLRDLTDITHRQRGRR